MKTSLALSFSLVVFATLAIRCSDAFASSERILLERCAAPRSSIKCFRRQGTFPRSGNRHDCAGLLNDTRRSLNLLRGGDVVVGAVAGRITTMALLSSVFATTHGALLVFLPGVLERLYSGEQAEEGSFLRFMHRATGAIALGVGISIYMSILGNISNYQAIGIGLLPRLLFLYVSFLRNAYDKMGMENKFLSVNTVAMSWATLSLITGVGNPTLAAKLFSVLALLKAGLLIADPILGGKKYFGLDLSGDDVRKEKAACQALGEYLVVSAIQMGALAFGVGAAKAAGYSSVAWFAVRAYLTFFTDSFKDAGVNKISEGVYTTIALLFAVGFLA